MQYIDINPEEVIIEYENNQFSPSFITVTNTYYQRVTFKIKATNPDLFTVKPNRGLIEPQGNIKIEIQAHADQIQDLSGFASQKFLIVAKDAAQVRSFAEIDDLWKKQQLNDPSVQQRKLSTAIIKVQNGVKQQLVNPKLISSIYVPTYEQRGGPTITSNGDANKQYESLIDKSYQIEESMIQARLKREKLYSEVAIHKKSGSASLLTPILIGVIIGFLQLNWQTVRSYL